MLLAFAAFFMSALVSRVVFDRLPHLEDEVAYLFQAKTYAGGNLVIPTPEPRRAFWMPFLIDRGGLRFGKYTPGWSMQLAVGVLLGQWWIINAFFSALTVALVYRLGREIFNPDVGVIAAALTTFSPMALLLNGTLMGHTSALFAATLFIYAYWRIERGRRTLLWGAVAGIALGMLVANRPITGVAVAVPLILWSGMRLFHGLALDLARLRHRAPSPAPLSAPEYRAATVEMAAATSDATQQARPIPAYAVATLEVPAAPTLQIPRMSMPRPAEPEPAAGFASARKVPVRGLFATLSPLLILSVFTLLIAAMVPINNYVAVGSPSTDLYTLVWSYDTVGFGPCCGRSGHNLEKGIRQARYDLSLTAADLFGWEIGSLTQPDGTIKPDVQNQLLNEGDYWLEIGISWILLPFAFVVAYRRKAIFIVIWVAVAYGLVWFALNFQHGIQMQNPVFSWLWLGTALIWLYLPLVFWRDQQRAWTWILWSVAVGLVVMQMSYWIGSQRYSTRYFFEGLTAIAIISALPLAWLARRISRLVIYAFLMLALAYSLYFYSARASTSLKNYNYISGDQVAGVQARRTGDQPVLVIINGSNAAWRSFGALMAQTSPYLNSDIVAAWNYEGDDGTVKQQILDRFPDRQVIEMNASGNYAWFSDQQPPPQVSGG